MQPGTAVNYFSSLSGKRQSRNSSAPETAGCKPVRSHPDCSPIPHDENWPINYDFVRGNLGALMEELMPDLLQTFFDDGLFRMHQFQTAVSDHDWEQIWKTAHTLKGSSATLGMLAFSSLCLQLETAAKSQDWNSIYPLEAQIRSEFAQIQAFLAAA